jgi:hypothetical protein
MRPNSKTLGTSVWYGNDTRPSDESSWFLRRCFLRKLQRREKGCITSHDRLAQPDVKT